MNYYVTYTTDLLHLDERHGVPTGKVRTGADGVPEAELICITPGANCEKEWIRKEQIT